MKRYDCHVGEYFERLEGDFVRFEDTERMRADNERLMAHVRASPSLSNQYVRLAETEITAQRKRADELHAKLNYANREPPHCPTCSCGCSGVPLSAEHK